MLTTAPWSTLKGPTWTAWPASKAAWSRPWRVSISGKPPSASKFAYEHNLVHRDIKPANLFVTNPAEALRPLIKILDWGLARVRPTNHNDQEVGENTGEPSLIGTADYLSPEQAMNPEGVDIRGDIYSLGCTLYFLLTGRPPFGGNGAMQKALQHMTAEPEPVDKLNPKVTRGLVSVVQRMMSKQPADRFQTPAAVALALSPACRAG